MALATARRSPARTFWARAAVSTSPKRTGDRGRGSGAQAIPPSVVSSLAVVEDVAPGESRQEERVLGDLPHDLTVASLVDPVGPCGLRGSVRPMGGVFPAGGAG